MLTLRPTGLSCPAYQDWPDYTVIEDGRAAGRLYEDRYTRPELRWFLVNHNPAVTSALASGLLYLSHPTLAARVGISRSCHFLPLPRRNIDGRFTSSKDLPSSLVQLRIAVWTGDPRDTRPKADIGTDPETV
jgi:hypothetical protein